MLRIEMISKPVFSRLVFIFGESHSLDGYDHTRYMYHVVSENENILKNGF
jgi:hypothetical protein